MTEDKEKCGNCFWWMNMPACPREYPVYGGHRGPSMYGFPCSKFITKENYYKHLEEAQDD